jgi:hypothetical protein
MPIRVTCEKCGGVLHAPDDAGGKKGRCPNCQNVLPIPFDGPRAGGTSGGGFSAPSSPSNPPAGMAFGTPASNPFMPNADARRPSAPPPPFGVGARGDSPGLASSTPGLGGGGLVGGPPPPIGSTMGNRSSAPFGARPAPASTGVPIAPESRGWRSAAGGLRWCQIAVVLFLVAVVAPCVVAAYGANGGGALAAKEGLLKRSDLSQLSELRLGSFLIPATLGALCLLIGRFKVGNVPSASCARGVGKLAAFFTLLAIGGAATFATMTGIGMKDGFMPTFEPSGDVLKIDTPVSPRVVRYLNDTLLSDKDMPGQAQRFGLFALIAFGKVAEMFFGCTLGRLAAATRNTVAAGRVTRCYFYFAMLGLLAAFGLLAFELFGQTTFREQVSPKWFAMPHGQRVGIVCGVAGLITLLLTFAYLRMLGGVRRACAAAGA